MSLNGIRISSVKSIVGGRGFLPTFSCVSFGKTRSDVSKELLVQKTNMILTIKRMIRIRVGLEAD